MGEDMEDHDFSQFVERLKQFSSIDLSAYKEPQMKRRLTTLRMKRGFASFAAYWEALTRDNQLYEEFLDRMTINVSEFWRNRNRWETLRDTLLPALLKESPRLKCWSAACSTGEEPYTLAMILDERRALDRASILATDIDKNALKKARDGIYSERSVREVPRACLDVYFRKENQMYAVSDALKPFIRFRRQNLLEDRFDSGFDLIICRNVMIYFTEAAKRKLYHKFAGALRTGGILFVGSTEQIFSPGRYGLESAETFFYRKKAMQV